MDKKITRRAYLDALEERVLVFDGAMGTSLQDQNLDADHFGGEQYNGCIDYLVISYPLAVEKVHRSFLEAGVDVIETDSFRANRLTLAEYGLQDKVGQINRAAGELARRLADEYSRDQQPRFVAGSIGPSGKLPSADDPDLSDTSYDELVEIFREQAASLVQGGVDLILIETSQDILEVKASITGVQKAFEDSGIYLPLQVQVSLDTTGRMLLGTDISAALAILEGLPIDVIGLNCSTGPEHMREPIAYLGENASLPVSCIPNAGMPLNIDGEAVYPLEPEPYAEAMAAFVEKNGINVVGGCCGTRPEHLKALVAKLGDQPATRRPAPERPQIRLAQLSSATRAVDMHQEPPPFLIGERCNAQGSRKFKRLLLEEDFDAVLEIARAQVAGGAHALDVSVAMTERSDETGMMARVVKLLASGVEAPLVIDTTEPEVMESALKIAPGRCLLNSTHLESGRSKADRVFELARRYNAAVLILTIDEEGMAKTAHRKLEVARKIYDIAVREHGLRPDALVFDTLTFTLATGDVEFSNSAIDTIEGIRLVKSELPGVFSSLGVSNVSFGLKPSARPVLNSVMLYHAVSAGLDMAIVNPAHISPYAEIPREERELAENLIFNRSPEALEHFIEYFEGKEAPAGGGGAQKGDPLADMAPEERLHWRIVQRRKDNIEADIDEIMSKRGDLSQHEAAVNILNTILLPAMKEVGDKFGSGELILPFVLQSAEAMKRAVSHLEGYLERQEGTSKAKAVIATVYGDVHDIGKNLVKTILSNNGYEVVDLGKQVPAETIISRAVEERADAIGLSALLVNTSKQMALIVNELQRRELNIPVLIGGAAINRRFGWRILFTDDGAPYQAGVFYCKDAFEGLATMERLIVPEQRQALLKELGENAAREIGRDIKTRGSPPAGARSTVREAPTIPTAPFWGARVVQEMPLEIIFKHLSKNELFRLSWGAKNARGEEWRRLEGEFEDRLESMQREALKAGWLKPQAVYGYWPAQSEGDDLVIFDPETINSPRPVEIMRFTFPRQAKGESLCLADYFAPSGADRIDTAIFQVVTVGQQATERFDQLEAEGRYSEAYYTHGLAVQTAEASAEYLHRYIRAELGIGEEQGKRYSWGYPAIPELEDHRKVFDLLPAEKELGMILTSAFQLVPEQSTAAIILHHPEARYFNTGESRVEQLVK